MLDKKQVVFGFPFALALLGSVGTAEAEALYLDELVVTGTRSERSLLETPVRTEVVTGRELKRTHARSLKEALQYVPGLQLRQIHGKPGYEVWLQGVEADRVLVLIDGMPMTATTGSATDVSQLSVLDIEKIEVVKGAVSAQYGSSAIGGVVNVITSQPVSGLSGELTVDAGTYGDQNPSGDAADPGRYSARASVQGGGERLALRLSASHQHSDGVDPDPETWSQPGDEYDRTDLSLRADWKRTDEHRLSAGIARFEEESESRYRLAPPVNTNQGKLETVRRTRYSLSGDHGFTNGVNAGWSAIHETLNDDTLKYSETSRFDDRRAESTLSKLSADAGRSLGDRHYLQGGVDFSKETLDQTLDAASELNGRQEREGQEIWFQDTWMPTGKLELVPGVRIQNDSSFGIHTAPKLNARYDLLQTDTLSAFIRAGAGAGYRVPNLKERYFVFDHSSLGYIVKGSENLKPEESRSYQLGAGVSQGRVAWLEVNAFYNDIEQLIQTSDTGVVNSGVAEYRYENIAQARTWGFETTAGWEPLPPWRVTAGYTYTRTEDKQSGNELNKRPRHQADLGVDGPLLLPGLTWSARVHYQSDEYTNASENRKSPGYTTADLKLNYQLSEQVRLFAGADNITNEQRDFSKADEDLRPVAGRFAYAGLTVSFSK
ncbi:TonB-dependent receptor [Marinobacter sp. S0848L]|uniref:TonB-dependent receptor plug domain-containing protein n=1 Tax=Marinobacter sp. S0848L TaxID=2926423 RepID=UPI001FF1FFF3|nr:TonB-dependent receptor [Marinobacter sp. S0848L]MCK0105010.1 TonB-dependent receptor [Marinobacter sp. S0848L]